ncbi:hypothetical protein AAH277_004321 [Escherichia coli]
MNPPHVAQYPVAVIAMVCRLVGEIGLIVLYPLVGVGQGEMMMNLCQLPNEVR